MAFVQDDVLPHVLLQEVSVGDAKLKRSDDDREIQRLLLIYGHFLTSDFSSFVFGSMIEHDWACRQPLVKLFDPVSQRRQWTRNQIRTSGVVLSQVRNE